jgi:zinc protease
VFVVWATALPGQELDTVESKLDEELARLVAEGPTATELERVKTQYRADFVRGMERIGGFGGVSDILAESEVYGGSPDYYKVRLERAARASAADLQRVARQWLGDGVYALEVHPFPEYSTTASTIDRGKLPEPDSFPAPRFPQLERAALSNGLQVIVAQRHGAPLVELNLLLDSGYAADQPALGGVPGTASLTMAMLDEGTATRSGLETSERLAQLGAQLGTGANLDLASVSLSALKENLDPSLEVFADVVLRPAFPEADFAREKEQRLAAIRREKATPQAMALRVFPRLLYGAGHPYGTPLTGSGTEESVEGLERADLVAFHRAWFKPGSATLTVVGDITPAEILPRLERLLGGWPAGKAPEKELATVAHRPESAVYLVDRPGSLQSMIYAGHVAPPRSNPNEAAIETMNEVLGQSFTSRINMNLREDKHWSYGANSRLLDARGQRPFVVAAPVQTDKTKESLAEIRRELEGIVGDRPPTADELKVAKDKRILTLPGRWETNDAVAAAIAQIVRFGLPDDYWRTYPAELLSLGLPQVERAAHEVVHPGQVVWVVVGDRAKIEPGIRELGLGSIQVIDADGNPVEETTAAGSR